MSHEEGGVGRPRYDGSVPKRSSSQNQLQQLQGRHGQQNTSRPNRNQHPPLHPQHIQAAASGRGRGRGVPVAHGVGWVRSMSIGSDDGEGGESDWSALVFGMAEGRRAGDDGGDEGGVVDETLNHLRDVKQRFGEDIEMDETHLVSLIPPVYMKLDASAALDFELNNLVLVEGGDDSGAIMGRVGWGLWNPLTISKRMEELNKVQSLAEGEISRRVVHRSSAFVDGAEQVTRIDTHLTDIRQTVGDSRKKLAEIDSRHAHRGLEIAHLQRKRERCSQVVDILEEVCAIVAEAKKADAYVEVGDVRKGVAALTQTISRLASSATPMNVHALSALCRSCQHKLNGLRQKLTAHLTSLLTTPSLRPPEFLHLDQVLRSFASLCYIPPHTVQSRPTRSHPNHTTTHLTDTTTSSSTSSQPPDSLITPHSSHTSRSFTPPAQPAVVIDISAASVSALVSDLLKGLTDSLTSFTRRALAASIPSNAKSHHAAHTQAHIASLALLVPHTQAAASVARVFELMCEVMRRYDVVASWSTMTGSLIKRRMGSSGGDKTPPMTSQSSTSSSTKFEDDDDKCGVKSEAIFQAFLRALHTQLETNRKGLWERVMEVAVTVVSSLKLTCSTCSEDEALRVLLFCHALARRGQVFTISPPPQSTSSSSPNSETTLLSETEESLVVRLGGIQVVDGADDSTGPQHDAPQQQPNKLSSGSTSRHQQRLYWYTPTTTDTDPSVASLVSAGRRVVHDYLTSLHVEHLRNLREVLLAETWQRLPVHSGFKLMSFDGPCGQRYIDKALGLDLDPRSRPFDTWLASVQSVVDFPHSSWLPTAARPSRAHTGTPDDPTSMGTGIPNRRRPLYGEPKGQSDYTHLSASSPPLSSTASLNHQRRPRSAIVVATAPQSPRLTHSPQLPRSPQLTHSRFPNLAPVSLMAQKASEVGRPSQSTSTARDAIDVPPQAYFDWSDIEMKVNRSRPSSDTCGACTAQEVDSQYPVAFLLHETVACNNSLNRDNDGTDNPADTGTSIAVVSFPVPDWANPFRGWGGAQQSGVVTPHNRTPASRNSIRTPLSVTHRLNSDGLPIITSNEWRWRVGTGEDNQPQSPCLQGWPFIEITDSEGDSDDEVSGRVRRERGGTASETNPKMRSGGSEDMGSDGSIFETGVEREVAAIPVSHRNPLTRPSDMNEAPLLNKWVGNDPSWASSVESVGAAVELKRSNETGVVSTASKRVASSVERYYSLAKAMPPLAFSAFRCMAQLLEVYIYAVAVTCLSSSDWATLMTPSTSPEPSCVGGPRLYEKHDAHLIHCRVPHLRAQLLHMRDVLTGAVTEEPTLTDLLSEDHISHSPPPTPPHSQSVPPAGRPITTSTSFAGTTGFVNPSASLHSPDKQGSPGAPGPHSIESPIIVNDTPIPVSPPPRPGNPCSPTSTQLKPPDNATSLFTSDRPSTPKEKSRSANLTSASLSPTKTRHPQAGDGEPSLSRSNSHAAMRGTSDETPNEYTHIATLNLGVVNVTLQRGGSGNSPRKPQGSPQSGSTADHSTNPSIHASNASREHPLSRATGHSPGSHQYKPTTPSATGSGSVDDLSQFAIAATPQDLTRLHSKPSSTFPVSETVGAFKVPESHVSKPRGSVATPATKRASLNDSGVPKAPSPTGPTSPSAPPRPPSPPAAQPHSPKPNVIHTALSGLTLHPLDKLTSPGNLFGLAERAMGGDSVKGLLDEFASVVLRGKNGGSQNSGRDESLGGPHHRRGPFLMLMKAKQREFVIRYFRDKYKVGQYRVR
eukprot:GHVN01066831.1.p1 GENE.GHVN01066831.1~~GHVN01066831.1.p1  ORF type:complete len:1764 (+),score=396.03 GHVN01066831.1:145-5436(+)